MSGSVTITRRRWNSAATLVTFLIYIFLQQQSVIMIQWTKHFGGQRRQAAQDDGGRARLAAALQDIACTTFLMISGRGGDHGRQQPGEPGGPGCRCGVATLSNERINTKTQPSLTYGGIYQWLFRKPTVPPSGPLVRTRSPSRSLKPRSRLQKPSLMPLEPEPAHNFTKPKHG